MPDRARPWSGEPPPRHLTSCYDRLRQALRRPLEPKLDTTITMMDEAGAPDGPSLVQGLLQRVQHEAGVSRAGGTPADDAPRKGVNSKGDIDETGPCRSNLVGGRESAPGGQCAEEGGCRTSAGEKAAVIFMH